MDLALHGYKVKTLTTSLAATLLVACTGGPGEATPVAPGADAGGPPPATPQVILAATVAKGSNTDCRDEGELFNAGTFGPPSAPVKNGETFGQGAVEVACTVQPVASGGFLVNGTVNLSGAAGGLYKVEGTFKTTGESTDIHVTASTRRSANTYDQRDCVARFTDPGQAVAAGRVWAEIVCPSAANTGDQTRKCEIGAEIRLENCTQ